jgi:cytochrome bd-type quinol oxidase subunit 2
MNIEKKILLLALLVASITIAPPVHAALNPCEGDGKDTQICKSSVSDLTGGILTDIINTMLVIAGVLAVIMIVVGGIRYITSDGDSNKANQARQTIIYAVVGVVVAAASYAIVNFVIGRLT